MISASDGRDLFDRGGEHLLAHDGVFIRLPDAQQRQDEVFLRSLPAEAGIEIALELLEAGRSGSGRWGAISGCTSSHHALDHRLRARAFRVEVVIEGAFGNLQIIQDILDGHLLIAFGVDEPRATSRISLRRAEYSSSFMLRAILLLQ